MAQATPTARPVASSAISTQQPSPVKLAETPGTPLQPRVANLVPTRLQSAQKTESGISGSSMNLLIEGGGIITNKKFCLHVPVQKQYNFFGRPLKEIISASDPTAPPPIVTTLTCYIRDNG